ncbi:hypothetical protein AMECASPLE_021599 [Ameca splendens]|uniref:Uncharacterized protein n=1 Tax=Ameca splendens TaxID=208324 RepID=A0ABV0YEV5_9TELE
MLLQSKPGVFKSKVSTKCEKVRIHFRSLVSDKHRAAQKSFMDNFALHIIQVGQQPSAEQYALNTSHISPISVRTLCSDPHTGCLSALCASQTRTVVVCILNILSASYSANKCFSHIRWILEGGLCC